MSKVSRVKINLASGNVVEKPLVTCFKGTNGSYLVLDNETNGSMGYPIICISKLNGNTAEKIQDQSEWASVKDNLKTIIAGTTLPYLSVPETLTAQDDFFTQLTLPVASFDLLKNVYQAPAAVEFANDISPAPVASVEPSVVSPMATPTIETPIIPVMPEPTPIATSDVIAPATAPIAQTEPVVPEIPIAPASPITSDFSSSPATVIDTPVMPNNDTSASAMEIGPMAPEVPIAISEANDDIALIKENFMKSCETMFDALLKKFENK